MPYIQIHTGIKLDETQQEKIYQQISEIIAILPGKTKAGLMLNILDEQKMFFRDESSSCLYASVNLYLMVADKDKAAFAETLALLLADVTGIDKNKMYISFQEYGNWYSNDAFK